MKIIAITSALRFFFGENNESPSHTCVPAQTPVFLPGVKTVADFLLDAFF